MTAVFVVATQVNETVSPVLTGETTMVGLGDPARIHFPATTMPPPPRRATGSRTVAGLRDAEELLDCLEAQGYKARELVILGKASFAVRWR